MAHSLVLLFCSGAAHTFLENCGALWKHSLMMHRFISFHFSPFIQRKSNNLLFFLVMGVDIFLSPSDYLSISFSLSI